LQPAGLCPNPLGEIKCSPDLLATIRGLLLREVGAERAKDAEKATMRGEGEGGRGLPPHDFLHDAPSSI